MGFGLNGTRGSRRILASTQKTSVSVHLLTFALSVAPFSARAADPVPLPTGVGQVGAQGAAANTNSLASNLATASSVLSMAAGGLYMAKGAEQMKCCASGCTGNGAASKGTKDNLDESAKNGASKITSPPKRQPLDYWKLRFPDEAHLNCPAAPMHSSRPGIAMLFDFLRPAPAQAAIGGCIDAMLALATGGLMLLNGVMGMKAANKSGQMADSSLGNMGNMSSYDVAGTSPTPERTAASLGAAGLSGNSIKMDPSLLRTGLANDIMGQFENKFGLGRDEFAKSVIAGEDPRKLLNSAPKNALSNEDMNKATIGAKAMTDAEKANALSGSALSNAEKELAARLGLGAGDSAFAVNMGGSGGSFKALSSKKKDEELEEMEGAQAVTVAGEESLVVSPEVQTALHAKALDERRNGITDLTLFQVVHNKYREKSKAIFGFDPDSMPRGVANTDGL